MTEVAQLSGHASYVRKVAFCEQSGVVFSASQTTVKVCRVEGCVHDTVVWGEEDLRESGENCGRRGWGKWECCAIFVEPERLTGGFLVHTYITYVCTYVGASLAPFLWMEAFVYYIVAHFRSPHS